MPEPSLEAAAEILQKGGFPRGPYDVLLRRSELIAPRFIPHTLLFHKMILLRKDIELEKRKVKMIEQFNIPEDLILPEKDPRRKVRSCESDYVLAKKRC